MNKRECWFGELKSKTKRGRNIIGDERPTPDWHEPNTKEYDTYAHECIMLIKGPG